MTAQLASRSLSARRIIVLLLAFLAACLLGISMMTQQANAKPFGSIEYTIKGDHVVITGFNTDHSYTSITVPETIEGYPVTEIQYGAFRQNSTWTKVTIQAKVTSIPDVCFYKCTNLKEVVLPDTVKSLGKVSFYGCENLTSVSGATNLEEIGEQAFMGCTGMQGFEIPDSVAGIGKEAFHGCKLLASIEVPANVATISEAAFSGCSSLASVKLNAGIKTIGVRAFNECKALSTLEIPDSLTAIEKEAFRYSGLTATNLPSGLTTLGEGAFSYCVKLASIGQIPASLTTIGNYAFSNCAFEFIALPDTITKLPDGLFFACSKLKSIALPDTLTSIGKCAFDRCISLEYLCVPASVTSIGNYAFGNLRNTKMVYFENGNKNWTGSLVFNSSTASSPGFPAMVVCAVGSANSACKSEAEGFGATFKTLNETGSYTVTHNANGGSGTMGDVTLPKGFAYAVPLCKFTKAHADFLCWQKDATNYQPGMALPASSANVTVTAQWEDWGAGNSWQVSFDSNGGSGALASYYVKKDATVTLPANPFTPPAGYTFSGWKLVPTSVYGEGILPPGAERMALSNITAKAQWVGQHTITFDARGGSVSPGTMQTNGDGCLDAWPEATRDGYVLEGWSTTDDSAGLTTLGRVYTGNTTLYAIWITQAEADTSGGDVSGGSGGSGSGSGGSGGSSGGGSGGGSGGSGGGGSSATTQAMHRLYNPNSGEHFYTGSESERDAVIAAGWGYEGIGWTAPATSSVPVHRLYNANGGEHHYTMDEGEKDFLVSVGWSYEGIGWYSDEAKTVPLFREYNPNAFANNHNYTTNTAEHEWLLSLGWQDEGYAWYGL